MITDKIKALFQFIEYLHSNIDNFNQYNGLIKELDQLNEELDQLKPRNNYKDKQQYDKVQAELESKLKDLRDNTANLIKAKAKELNVCNFDTEPNYSFNDVETEIRQLKDNFSNKDLPEIFRHKSLYLEYRSQTHSTFYSLQIFFVKLDKIAKSLFDYFKDTEQNEFEPFETKAIPVNSIEEAIQRLKQGQTNFSLPPSVLITPSTSENRQNKTEPPQPINNKTKPVKYKADEYALAYIFDLYAEGKQVPKNRIEGGLSAKKIKDDSTLFSSYDKTPDGFYRAVKKVLTYDLNKPKDLQNISNDWYNAIKVLSNNWALTEQYLKDKNLIKE